MSKTRTAPSEPAPSEPKRPATLDEVTGLAPGASGDLHAEAYQEAIAVIRAAAPSTVDLLTAPVTPDSEIVTQVNCGELKFTGKVEAIGPTSGQFSILSSEQNDAGLLTVTVRNDGLEAARFCGLAYFEPAPASAS